jgi:hypothetical protein
LNATNFNFGGFVSAGMIAAPCTSSIRQKKLLGSRVDITRMKWQGSLVI